MDETKEVADAAEELHEEEQQMYDIATGRERGKIRPPQRYGYADLVSFALNVAETIEYQEPTTYNEAVLQTVNLLSGLLL